jgi:Cu/Zn superoxide dismutase
MKKFACVLAAISLVALAACGGDEEPTDEATDVPTMESPAEEEASVAFVSPEDNAEMNNPVKVHMEAQGVAIEPAARGVKPRSGHFHIMVDTDCVQAGQVIPNDAAHIHYGMGQKEAELTLTPGEHALCLQVADANHTAMELTHEIQVTVRL